MKNWLVILILDKQFRIAAYEENQKRTNKMFKFTKSNHFKPLLIVMAVIICSGCSVNNKISENMDNVEETILPTENAISESAAIWSTNTHSNDVEPNYDIVFTQTEVLEFNIIIDGDDWQTMQDDLKNNSSSRDYEPVWVTAKIVFNDNTWEYVGIRYKGNSSLKSAAGAGVGKLSFKLDFDEFEDLYPQIEDQRFYGFKQLNLNNNYSDTSFLHEKIGADLFREFGVASSQTAFCAVNVDYGEGLQYFGLYTLVEEMDDTGIETQFGDDSGNLYKPEGKGASFAAGSYNDSDMEKKNNEDESDYTDVAALYEIINSDMRTLDIDSWKSELEKVFNVDVFLKWLAANTVIQNWDTYGVSTHNFYLYNNPETNQLNWVPWDNNEAFTNGKKDRDALGLELSEVNESWPLIRYIIDEPSYKSDYDSYVLQFVTEVFSEEKIIKTYDEYYEMIKEYVYDERIGYTFLKSDNGFDSAIEALKIHVKQRNEAVLQYLSQ